MSGIIRFSMRRGFLLLVPALLLGACCTGFLGQPPGLSRVPPRPRPVPHMTIKPPGGAAIEGKSVDVDGVGHAVVITSATPDPEATATPTPDEEDGEIQVEPTDTPNPD